MVDLTATALDIAHAKMQADNIAKLSFYERLLEAEIFMILEDEPDQDNVRPLVLDTSDCSVALVFDREDRLAEFAAEPVPYLALSGRKIVTMLAGENIGLGVNLGAGSETVLQPDIIDWLAENMAMSDNAATAMPLEICAPLTVPAALVTALDTKLANMSGVVETAYLVFANYDDGSNGHMLALCNVVPDAQNGVAEALSEALLFSGVKDLRLDITFLQSLDASIPRFAKAGLKFEIPELILPVTSAPLAPGMDPDKPPKLR